MLNVDGLRALTVLGIVCSGALQSRALPLTNEDITELLATEVLCGANHASSSIAYSVDDQACSMPFNTDFLCPTQIFLRHAQDHTEPPAGSVSIPE